MRTARAVWGRGAAQPAGAVVGRCRTLDQARAVVTFLDAASEKTLRSTVALTAARGRGKVRSRLALHRVVGLAPVACYVDVC